MPTSSPSPSPSPLDFDNLLSARTRSIDASGIRRAFALGAKLKNPYNFSIGQPDFPVPEPLKHAAIEAIRNDQNGYTQTQGTELLRNRIAQHLADEVGWHCDGSSLDILITSGTSGALILACMAMLNPGDEIIIPDPWFVLYPQLGTLTGATAVRCDTYPDFAMTAERIEPLITDRTKILLVNSPGNPTGVVLTSAQLRDLVDLCHARGVLLLSDEIYDEFVYSDALEDGAFPTPARCSDQLLLVRGFGKTYGCTGWRLGYAAGPAPLIQEMAKLQQYTYVCAPSMAQAGVVPAFDVDMQPQVDRYQGKRDLVQRILGSVTRVVQPGGAFYAFIEIPPALGITGQQFIERAIERNVIIIPGNVFSRRDTHFRLSYAVSDDKLEAGLHILAELLRST